MQLRTAGILLALVTAISGLPVETRGQAIELKLAHPFAPDSPQGEGVAVVADWIQAASSGEFEIEVHAGGQLGSASEIPQLLTDGSIDLGLTFIRAFERIEPDLAVFRMPSMFSDIGTARRFQESETGRSLLDNLKAAGIKGLSYWHVGTTQVFTAKQVFTTADLKGLKIRSLPGDDQVARSLMELGANPVPMSSAEVYTALEAGSIDGVATTLSGAADYDADIYSIVNTPLSYSGAIFASNVDAWERLTEAQKTLLVDVLEKARGVVTDELLKSQETALRQLTGKGATIINAPATSLQTEAARTDLWAQEAAKLGVRPEVVKVASEFGGTGGGNDPCPIDTCRCSDRTCATSCCRN